MLGLYFYTLIIGHKSCNTCMLSILNKLTLQKELQTISTKNMFLDKKNNTTTTKEKKIKHKNHCRSRELNPGNLAPKADVLLLHHRVN